MDQLTLALIPPGIGHNHPPERIDLIEGLNARLTATHTDLVAHFRDLELACGWVTDLSATKVHAATATDFIAQCRLQLKHAEAARKQEKAPFVRAGRAVDAFFKGRCERLSAALAPSMARLKAYRGHVAVAERQRHEQAQGAEDARPALADGEAHCARAERLSQGAQSFEERRDAAGTLRHANKERAEAASQIASAPLEATRIRGDHGAMAFARRSWSFEVVDLDEVPREYMSLDVPVVRPVNAAIEARLRRKLPHCMREIDFVYGGARVSPEAGEGTDK